MIENTDQTHIYNQVKINLLDAGNVLIQTSAKHETNGWSNVDAVYEQNLIPLIHAAKRVLLAGYAPSWIEGIAQDRANYQWPEYLTQNAQKNSKLYFIQKDVLLQVRLKEFWVQPFLYVPRTDGLPGNKLVRPAVIVFEFDVDSLPVSALCANIESLGAVSNPWAGGKQQMAAKRRCMKQRGDKNTVLLPYENLGSFLFIAAEEALGKVVDKLMSEGGLASRYEEWQSSSLKHKLHCDDHEEILDCVERIIRDIGN